MFSGNDVYICTQGHLWPHVQILDLGSVNSNRDFTRTCTVTQLSILLQLLDERVSLYFKLSHYPCLIPPPTSCYAHTDPARWLSRRSSSPHPSLPIHQSFHIRYHSEDKVPNPSSVPPPVHQTVQLLFPSNKQRIHEVAKKQHRHLILQHLCIGLWPWITHHLQASTLERWKRWGVGATRGVGELLSRRGHSKNRGWFKWHEERTYLLPGPRLSRPKFDVPSNQLIPSC